MKITPPDQTAMTIERQDGSWFITVEQGNGDVIRTLKLTPQEYDHLALMMGRGWPHSLTFRDHTR